MGFAQYGPRPQGSTVVGERTMARVAVAIVCPGPMANKQTSPPHTPTLQRTSFARSPPLGPWTACCGASEGMPRGLLGDKSRETAAGGGMLYSTANDDFRIIIAREAQKWHLLAVGLWGALRALCLRATKEAAGQTRPPLRQPSFRGRDACDIVRLVH
jgi:hypothetical protein